VTPQSRWHIVPRFDVQLNDKNTLTFRYGYSKTDNQNTGIGQFSLASRAYESLDTDHTFQATETAVLSPHAINETRFQFIRSNVNQNADNNLVSLRFRLRRASVEAAEEPFEAAGQKFNRGSFIVRNVSAIELGFGGVFLCSTPNLLFIPDADAEQMQWFNDLQRITSSPKNASRLANIFGEIDVRHLLTEVRTPTLVLHSREDARVRFLEGQELAAKIANARFVPLDGRNHILMANEPAWPIFLQEVRSFIGDE